MELTNNYWDSFQSRFNDTISTLKGGRTPRLQRLTVQISCAYNGEIKIMPLETVKRIIEEYSAMGGKIIHFTGIDPAAVEYFQFACRYAKQYDLLVSAHTSGYYPIDVYSLDKLKIWFDTIDENVFNKKFNDSQAYDRTIRNLHYFSEAFKHKMIAFVSLITKQNFRQIVDLASFVQNDLEIENLYFCNYKGDKTDVMLEESEVAELFDIYIPQTLEILSKSKKQEGYRHLSLFTRADFGPVKQKFFEVDTTPCYVQLSEMTVNVFGKCYHCSQVYQNNDGRSERRNKIDVNTSPLSECFAKLKEGLNGNYYNLSDKCLSGCAANLIAFNKAVQHGGYL